MKKIMVVDDNASIRYVLRASLGDLKEYKIVEAVSGEEAVEMALEVMPELIFMDVVMPGQLDGLEATKKLKNNPRTKDIKVVMLTAMRQKSDIDSGFMAGADDYFAKPFSPMELVKKVDEVLGL
ncbi:MAG: response regulator [Nitrospina sp.]|jgi:CheY-like chemotaxis protein|nr:response regulator [Nitrospina sp.]